MQASGGGETLRILEWIASAIGGALTGALVAVVTFRTKLALLEQRIGDVDNDKRKDHERIQAEITRRDAMVD